MSVLPLPAGFTSGAAVASPASKPVAGAFAAGTGAPPTSSGSTPTATTGTDATTPAEAAATLVAAIQPGVARLAGSAAALLSQLLGTPSAPVRPDSADDPLAPLQSLIDAVTSLPSRLAQVAGVDTATATATAPAAPPPGTGSGGPGLGDAVAQLATAIDDLTASGAASSQLQVSDGTGGTSPVTLGLDLSSGTTAAVTMSGAPDLMAQLQAAKPQLLTTLDGLGLDTNLLSLKFGQQPS